jgi:hypothetical protein
MKLSSRLYGRGFIGITDSQEELSPSELGFKRIQGSFPFVVHITRTLQARLSWLLPRCRQQGPNPERTIPPSRNYWS